MGNGKSKQKIYNQVVERIREGIARGDFPQGSPLPPERQLIEMMKVSRSSLREGFRILEMVGLIETNRLVEMYQKVMNSHMNDLNSDAITKLASTKA